MLPRDEGLTAAGNRTSGNDSARTGRIVEVKELLDLPHSSIDHYSQKVNAGTANLIF